MDVRISAPATIIVVDDDPDLLRALGFSLELEGYRVITHARAETVRAADLPDRSGCLVIDQILPGEEDGLTLLKRLQGQGVTLPAVIITTHPGAGLIRAAHALGARIVEKPLLGPELISEIKALIPIEPC